MAASLLAGIDWTDLDSAEMTTAVRILCIAMQERFNIGAMRYDGTYFAAGTVADPSDNILKDMFPYKSNTPRWPLNDDDPLVDYTTGFAAQDNLIHLIQNTAQKYADIEKWNDAATDKDSGDTLYTLWGAADAPGTYDNRLLEVTGYTTYPDLSVMAPEEVKKLYDMVVVMRYVVRSTQDNFFNQTVWSNMEREFNGEFDISETGAFGDGDNGKQADYYGSVSDISPITDVTSYTDFETGNSNLFGSSSASYNAGTAQPFYLGHARPYYIKLIVGSGYYRNLIRAAQTSFLIDWAVPRAIMGFVGSPLEYKTQANMVALTNTFPTGFDTNFDYPASTTTTDQRYWETVSTSTASDIATVERDNLLVSVTLPASPSSLATNDTIVVNPEMSTTLAHTMLEDWGGDGGFEYY